jgi:UDP-N-acetylmuramate--alanine ligase
MTAGELATFLTGAQPRRIHLIGVAGSGMSGIAALLLGLGHKVGGSDRVDTVEVERLVRKGLDFHTPHSAASVQGAELVIHSSAIKAGNPAFDEAVRLGIPMARRAEALAALMSGRKGVVVCGMHGKTTTAAMAAHVLKQGGFKPSHYVGAEIPILGTNARWDSEGDLFVAEGDESDGTLVHYSPAHSIVLNIEPEHLDFYRDLAHIEEVFGTLLSQTTGHVVHCRDDAGATHLCRNHPRAVSYGTSPEADFRMVDHHTNPGGTRFRVEHRGRTLGEVELTIPGIHNAENAMAVLTLATLLGQPFDSIASALATFRGAKRRFEVVFDSPTNKVVDDYGHHPTEIAATLATARAASRGGVVAMFQPHRYSRTAHLIEAFGAAFDAADHVFVTDIYPAGEAPMPGVSGQLIVDTLGAHGHRSARFVPGVEAVHRAAAAVLADGDLVLSLGAGNIHEAGKRLADDLALRDSLRGVMGPGALRLHEPLSKHTTMRVGGPARIWAEPETEEGFAELVRHCFDEGIPLLVMGRGSNLLVRDGGFPGVVAHLARGCFLETAVDGTRITSGVGVRFKQLAALARGAGIAGFEWMEGIPGSLGGGLRMNAGAMGIQTFEQVERVRFCDQDGNIFTKTPTEMEVLYRDVPMLRTNYALSAVMGGRPGTKTEIDEATTRSIEKRKATQPVAASAGCIFKNPGPLPAGRLVEELGLKNLRKGGARVSEVHANFIVNDGGATAADVLALIEEIRTDAKTKRGIELETEVQIVGVDP